MGLDIVHSDLEFGSDCFILYECRAFSPAALIFVLSKRSRKGVKTLQKGELQLNETEMLNIELGLPVHWYMYAVKPIQCLGRSQPVPFVIYLT
jgi:hypothetical protein